MRNQKILVLMLMFLLGTSASMLAQVRIGGSYDPHPAAILDLNATDVINDGTLGLALPRVELKNTIVASSSIVDPAKGMLVYNTKAENNVVTGLYYFDGTSWVLLNSGTVDVGVTNVSSSITGLTVSNGATTPTLSVTGTPGATKYLDGSGAWSTPAISLTAGTATGQVIRWNGTAWVVGYPPQTGTLNDVDGNTYSYACFGAAGCWMTENLRVTKYAHSKNTITWKNGVINSSDYNKREWEYPGGKDSVNNKHAYGLLYTWAAASNRTDVSDDEFSLPQTQYQGICPDGWHLPSYFEWDELISVIRADKDGLYSSITADGNANWKMMSATPVTSATYVGASNNGAKNGFDALAAGCVFNNAGQASLYYGQYPYFYTSWSRSASNAVFYYMQDNFTGDPMRSSVNDKRALASVRCKKN